MDLNAILKDPGAAMFNALGSGRNSARNRAFQKQQDDDHWGRVESFTSDARKHEVTMAQDRYNHESGMQASQQRHEARVVREHGNQHRQNVEQAGSLPGGSSVSWGPGVGSVTTPKPVKAKAVSDKPLGSPSAPATAPESDGANDAFKKRSEAAKKGAETRRKAREATAGK
jgi:hypothetical protein